MKPSVPLSEIVDKNRQAYWRGPDAERPPSPQELFRTLREFRESHPVDIMAEYDRIRKGSD